MLAASGLCLKFANLRSTDHLINVYPFIIFLFDENIQKSIYILFQPKLVGFS